VGAMYDLRMAIEKKIDEDKLDPAKTRGMIGLKAGRLLSFITPSTADDPATITKMRDAARELLHANL
jgi:hypothetical protein